MFCDRLIIFAKDGAEYFDGGYDLFLEKIGWEEEEQVEKVKTAPKVNKKENKKLRAALVQERSKLTSPLKKEIEKLEKFIKETEEKLEVHHKELIDASTSGDNSKVMEVSKIVADKENEVEENFEFLEVKQNELDDILESYEEKLVELEG